MTDRIYLHQMVFEGRHGVTDEERATPQQIEVDLEIELDLAPAGTSDDLADTVDYSDVFAVCRDIVEERSFHLLEGIAEAIAAAVLAGFGPVDAVFVGVKKPGVPLAGEVEYAGVAIERRRGRAPAADG
ncbi:MAG: dihydroneopterin aldolase [Chloroflexota bacterium]|nr:dihydroneopterin aldolase [Chloroflexota bacterium]